MIRVADPDPSRCKVACEMLEAGNIVPIGEYSVRLINEWSVEVGVPTRWHTSNQSRERQAEEIAEAKEFFRTTAFLLPFLGDRLNGLKFSFVIIDDYRSTAISLTNPTTPERI